MTVEEALRELGLGAGSSVDDVRAAWRHAARRWHPDRAVDDPEVAARRFSAAQAAYTYLLAQMRTEPSQPSPAPDHLPQHDPFAHVHGPTRDGADLYVHVPVSLAQVLAGAGQHKDVTVSYPLPHPPCKGLGCDQCRDGAVTHTALARIKLPEGLTGTATITRPRRGGPGWGGGRPGDMTVTYDVLDEPGWRLRDGVLYGTTSITVAKSLQGGVATVRTPAGASIEVRVPEGGSGTVRVLEAGVPTARGVGEAVIEIKVRKLDLSNPAVLRALDTLHEAEGGL